MGEWTSFYHITEPNFVDKSRRTSSSPSKSFRVGIVSGALGNSSSSSWPISSSSKSCDVSSSFSSASLLSSAKDPHQTTLQALICGRKGSYGTSCTLYCRYTWRGSCVHSQALSMIGHGRTQPLDQVEIVWSIQ